MKTIRFSWLLAGLLALAGAALAQPTPPPPGSPLVAADSPGAAAGATSSRPVLGGPPQLAPAAALAGPGEFPELALLRQLPLAAVGQPGQPAQLLPAELARVFPPGVRPPASFRLDIAALATATAVAGHRELVALAWPLGRAGVPAGGAAPGQRLRLLTAAGEQLVAVARPAAAGSHSLVVSASPGLAGQSVLVAGLEHPAAPTLNYEALTLLGLRTAQQLAQQLATAQQQLADVQQQLAALRSQLATTQRLNGELLLDHAAQEDLRQQLTLLQSRLAASAAAHSPRNTGWPVD